MSLQKPASGGNLNALNGSDEGKNRMRTVGSLAIIFAQVLLVAIAFQELNLLSSAFRRVIYITAAGFLINHFLPPKIRVSFFALFSCGGAFLILGGTSINRLVDPFLGLERTGAILVIAAALISICHLPIGFWKRATLLLVAGFVMAIFRSGAWASGSLAIIWPVLAAMFMFRVMVYLYDVSVDRKRPTKSQSVAYFFLIPNVCTLLFPVIDFRTFCNKYYDEEALVIYQRGAKWMVRGLVHLLLYRLVERLWGIKISDVANGTDLIRFVVSNSCLYLNVSGTFHLCIGLLLLFGFNLPETNHRYFLASSFTDYWRRVNIYWRNFIMKVFYYPAFFRLKKLGQVKALILATIWSFFVTWALHFYQTWWIAGEVSFKWPDVLFWTFLALLVLINSLWEFYRGRKRSVTTDKFRVSTALGLSARTAATFAIISVLWSLWSTPNFGQWLFIWSLADKYTLGWGAVVLACIVAATFLFEILPKLRDRPKTVLGGGATPSGSLFKPGWLQCSASLAIIFALWFSLSQKLLPFPGLESFSNALINSDRVVRTSLPRQGRGYYESLTEINWANQQLWETLRREPFPFTPLRRVHDFRWNELIPSVRGKHIGVEYQTNRWGMRDRDYELKKNAGTLRLALLGSSNIAGYGVEAPNMFEPIVEARLNDEHIGNGRFEILNFAVDGVGPLGQITVLQKSVTQFAPDVVLFCSHLNDADWMNRDIQGGMREHLPHTYEFLDNILIKAGVNLNTTEKVATARLNPYEPEMLLFTYQQIVQYCNSIKALPVCVFIPLPQDLPLQKTKAAKRLNLAREAGFVVIDLSDIYDKELPQKLMLDFDSTHGNARANAIIAANLYAMLITNPKIDLIARVHNASVPGASSGNQSPP